MRYAIILIIILSVPAITHAATLKVPSQYPTIQDAIDAASAGDTVLVAPGTYVENIDFKKKAITVISEKGVTVTIIDGNQAGSVVIFNSGENQNSVLEGFTITNGSGTYIDSYWEYGGGGIFCNGSSPIIQHCKVSNNAANNGGGIGGIYNSSPLITNNTVSMNFANTASYKMGGGGGIVFGFDSDPEITHNYIFNNVSNMAGGGIAFGFDCDPKVRNNILNANTANVYAGGIQIFSGTAGIIENNIIMKNSSLGALGAGGISCRLGSFPMIANNVISGNSAVTYGGGMRCFLDSFPTIKNNLIYGNKADISGGGIQCDSGTSVTITNTILWHNEAPAGIEMWIGPGSGLAALLTISYSDVEGGMASVYVDPASTLNWGPGMIDSDPLFVDPSNDDFHLTFNSPCRGSGDNSAVTELTDFEGDPRIAYGTVDIGADEFYTHLYWTGDATPGGNVEIKFVGLPGTMPVGLCIGTGVLDPPIPSMWGDWYLQFPMIGPIDLGSITSPEGVLIIPGTIPTSPPVPYSIPMQALIGAELTNLSVLKVE